MTRGCAVRGCRMPTRPGHLLCLSHWFGLPHDIARTFRAWERDGILYSMLGEGHPLGRAAVRVATAQTYGRGFYGPAIPTIAEVLAEAREVAREGHATERFLGARAGSARPRRVAWADGVGNGPADVPGARGGPPPLLQGHPALVPGTAGGDAHPDPGGGARQPALPVRPGAVLGVRPEAPVARGGVPEAAVSGQLRLL